MHREKLYIVTAYNRNKTRRLSCLNVKRQNKNKNNQQIKGGFMIVR